MLQHAISAFAGPDVPLGHDRRVIEEVTVDRDLNGFLDDRGEKVGQVATHARKLRDIGLTALSAFNQASAVQLASRTEELREHVPGACETEELQCLLIGLFPTNDH